MGNTLFTYVQHLEMMAFFSGYPLIHYILRVISRKALNNQGSRMISLLPFAYALVGTLYLGLQLSNFYPDYTFVNIKNRIQQPVLLIWGLLSLLFWLPALSRKQLWSVLHSLVFFFFIIKDLFFYLIGQIQDQDIIKNDMRVYTVSIFLNLAAYTLLFLLSHLLRFRKKFPES